ncbi:MAG: hypothetical protein Q4D66_05075 [Bacteroidales bacterium]|nr:hypothetical protein [Bacteroidales bacterium]
MWKQWNENTEMTEYVRERPFFPLEMEEKVAKVLFPPYSEAQMAIFMQPKAKIGKERTAKCLPTKKELSNFAALLLHTFSSIEQTEI